MTKSVYLIAAAAAITQFLAAQPAAPTNSIYASTTTYHVPDETRGAFESWMKDKYRRLMEGMMKEDANIQAALLSRVVFGGVEEPAANYFLTVMRRGVPTSAVALQNKLSQQLFGKPYADVLKEAFPLRKRLGQTLSRQWAGTPANIAEGDIIRIDRKRVTAGRMGDYLQTEQQLLKLREAQVAAGRLKSWGAWSLVLPAGSEREFDAFTSHVAKDLESSLNWNQGSNAIGSQLNPPVNGTALSFRAADLAKTVRGDTRVVVMFIKRP